MTNKQELIKVCVDFARNPEAVTAVAQSEGKSFDEVLRAKFFEILGVEKVNRRVMSKASTKELVFEIISEAIEEGFAKGVEEDEFFAQFADTRFLARGDQNEFYIADDTTLVVSEHAGNHWNIRRQKVFGGSTITVETKPYAVGVYGDFEAFMTGRASFEELINKAVKAMKQKLYSVVAVAFTNAATALPNQFKQTGTYSDDKLITLYDHVAAESQTRPVIVGTKAALKFIAKDVVWYSDAMKDARNNSGRIGTYLGMDLVELPTVHKAGTFDFAYEQDVLYILPNENNKLIKLVIEGDDLIKTTNDEKENNDMAFDHKQISRYGANVAFSSLIGIYDNITA